MGVLFSYQECQNWMLFVDNSRKTVDKHLKLGKTRTFVRILWLCLPPPVGGIHRIKPYAFYLSVGWKNSLDSTFCIPGCLGIKITPFTPKGLPARDLHRHIYGTNLTAGSFSTYPQALLRLLYINPHQQIEIIFSLNLITGVDVL